VSDSEYHLGYFEGFRNATAMLIQLAMQLKSEESAKDFNNAIMALAEERDRAKKTYDEQVEWDDNQ